MSEPISTLLWIGVGVVIYAVLSRGLLVLLDPLRRRWLDRANDALLDANLAASVREMILSDREMLLSVRVAWLHVAAVAMLAARRLIHHRIPASNLEGDMKSLERIWPSYSIETTVLHVSNSLFATVLFWTLLTLVMGFKKKNRDDSLLVRSQAQLHTRPKPSAQHG